MNLVFLADKLPADRVALVRAKAQKAAPGEYNNLYEDLLIKETEKYLSELQSACKSIFFNFGTSESVAGEPGKALERLEGLTHGVPNAY